MKIGIIGCGAIGGELARFVAEKKLGTLHALHDIKAAKIDALLSQLPLSVKTLPADQLIKECDLIIEAATKDIVPDILRQVIFTKKKLMIMSIGGLIGSESLLDEARARGATVYLPTGAIAAIDALHAAKEAGLRRVTLTTTKPPQGFKGVEYITQQKINLLHLTEPTILFEGSARDAITHFPKNINVSSLLALAGLGADKTTVTIVCDPHTTTNTHQLTITSAAGTIKTTVENVPSQDNPQTSALAISSAKATLKKLFDTVKIGT